MTGWKHDRRSRQARGYDRRYEIAREAAMQRDQHLCQPCAKQGRPTPATECDHITPKHKADASGYLIGPCGNRMHMHDLRNLQAICVACHRPKSDREAAEAQGRQSKRMQRHDGW